MPKNRLSGVLSVAINGVLYNIQGNWTYNFGSPKRESKIGPNGVQGYKEMPQAPFVEGEVTDAADLDVKELQALEDATISLDLANGKRPTLRNAWYAADGNIGTDEANIQIRFEGLEMVEA